MKKLICTICSIALALAALTTAAIAAPHVPDETEGPLPPVMAEPLVGYALDAVDEMAAAAGYRRVTGTPESTIRKYVSVSDDWIATYVVITEDFAYQSVADLASDFPGAIHGHPISISDGMVLSVYDFVRDWFPAG